MNAARPDGQKSRLSSGSLGALLCASAIFCAASASAAPSPVPARSPLPSRAPLPPRKAAFSNKVHLPNGGTYSVSAAACDRSSVGVTSSQGTMGPNGATKSQTLVAVPIGGQSVSTATTQQQIAEACAHQRH